MGRGGFSAHCRTSQPELLGNAVSFELLSFMLEEGRRKSKQVHPQSYQYLGSS